MVNSIIGLDVRKMILFVSSEYYYFRNIIHVEIYVLIYIKVNIKFIIIYVPVAKISSQRLEGANLSLITYIYTTIMNLKSKKRIKGKSWRKTNCCAFFLRAYKMSDDKTKKIFIKKYTLLKYSRGVKNIWLLKSRNILYKKWHKH